MEENTTPSRPSLREIILPVRLVKCQVDEDSTVEYFIYDASNRIIADLEWDDQGKKDGELLVQLINSTNL